METFPALLSLCEGDLLITGGFPSQRPVARTFQVFFDVRLNKWLEQAVDKPVIWDAMGLLPYT